MKHKLGKIHGEIDKSTILVVVSTHSSHLLMVKESK